MNTNIGVKRLREIEESIAMTDRQRIMVMRTTDLAVATVLRDNWDDVVKTHAISEMIARRMFSHYGAQKELKKQIGLSVIPSASGILQQVVGTYLRAYLESKSMEHFQVNLDKRYDGKLQPDIAVEFGGDRWAAIEIKTDLGWHRDYASSGACIYGHKEHWDYRRQQCLDAGFKEAYLLILANTNWPGFKSDMEAQGVRVLLCTSPNYCKFKWYKNELGSLEKTAPHAGCNEAHVIHPVENLFAEIAQSLP